MEFYNNYFETGDLLPTKKEQDEFYGAIIRFLYKGEEPEFKSPYLKMAFQGIRPSLAKQETGRRNRKGKDKQTRSKPEAIKEANQKQTESIAEVNEKENQNSGKEDISKEEANKLSSIDSPIAPIEEVVTFLNDLTGKNFRSDSRKTRDLIKARFNEGFTLEDFKTVIQNKAAEWLHDPRFDKFLRPETLFSTKFESYLNERQTTKGGGELDADLEQYIAALSVPAT